MSTRYFGSAVKRGIGLIVFLLGCAPTPEITETFSDTISATEITTDGYDGATWEFVEWNEGELCTFYSSPWQYIRGPNYRGVSCEAFRAALEAAEPEAQTVGICWLMDPCSHHKIIVE